MVARCIRRGSVVGDRGRPMQRAPVVPHHQVVLAPAVPVDVLGSGAPLDELGHEGPAFLHRHPFDAFDVAADEEAPEAGRGMGAHQRMACRRDRVHLAFRYELVAEQANRVAVVVHRHEPFQRALSLVGQGLPADPHRCERGVAVLLRRHLASGKNRAHRGDWPERAVRVPAGVDVQEQALLRVDGEDVPLVVDVR